MEVIANRVLWASQPADLETDLRRVRRLAILLDSQFKILGYRVGLDPIIGLVPFVGDAVGALIGVYPIIIARKHGFSRKLQARMAVNLLIEWAIGEVPFLGAIFDAALKANLKNANLLECAASQRRGGTRSEGT